MIKEVKGTAEGYEIVLDSGRTLSIEERIEGFCGNILLVEGPEGMCLYDVETEKCKELKMVPRPKRQHFELAGRKCWFLADSFENESKTLKILAYLQSFKSSNLYELHGALIKELIKKDCDSGIEIIARIMAHEPYQLAETNYFENAFEMGRELLDIDYN